MPNTTVSNSAAGGSSTSGSSTNYVGRFAPSPTGPLHMGSLVAALASFLDARAAHGVWLLRMEDLDPPRETPQAAEHIVHSLRDHGLRWDGDIVYQHTRSNAYERALQQLSQQGLLFRCACSRTQLDASAGLHQGFCQSHNGPFALRVPVDQEQRCFDDRLQGRVCERLNTSAGDIIVKRKEGLYAYQLAVVVDDAWQQVSHIVRGADLLDSTVRQIYLQQCLQLPTPVYLHIPVLNGSDGQKLSKQNLAPAIEATQAIANLRLALRYLQQPEPPPHIKDVSSVLDHAIRSWQPDLIPRCPALPA
jgi:glutamyl-Q tRNA(Asp) synthetase